MKVYIETLGCPKNQVDSENMAGILIASGYELSEDPQNSDIMILNTCGFINDAKIESIEMIFELVALKDFKDSGKSLNDYESKQSKKLLVVTGCLTQRYTQELYEEIPEVDIIIGVNDYARLPEIIYEYLNTGERIKLFHAAPDKYYEINERKKLEEDYSSYLRIAEGCDNICTYCVIPYIRGGYRSRKIEDIVTEARKLAGSGTKELIIVAQDTTSYGKDLYGDYKLAELLSKLCEIDSIEWIRLMYCYEDSITDELINVMFRNQKICRYIDLPLQHINDDVLKNMNRRSTKDSIKETIKKLREGIPDLNVRTTFITGFPGETDRAYQELVDFIKETQFDRLGVFAYSAEDGTPAEKMAGQISEALKTERRDEIMEIQREISLKKNISKIGKVLKVLVEEGPDEDQVYIGRTEFDAKDIDNNVIFTSEKKIAPGNFVNVKIIDAFDYDLVGIADQAAL